MSDSEDSTVTYTEVSSPFADLSDNKSPGVDGPLVRPDDPYAYVVAAFQAPPSPDYVPGPEEPEFTRTKVDGNGKTEKVTTVARNAGAGPEDLCKLQCKCRGRRRQQLLAM
ncbi:hypothetical protein Tco_1550318 [Tanacetum coccineum]